MADDWYYTQRNERHGPVSPAKLKSLAAEGWLTPTDLVWKEGMPNWVPAGKVRGLFANPLVRTLTSPVDGVVATSPADAATLPQAKPPAPRQTGVAPSARSPAVRPALDWDALKPRHAIAACGGFIAALGVAFTAIAHSPLALAFTLGGLVLVAIGMYAEVGRLLGQAVENVGKASREAADRRQEARKLAVEKKRLDLEAQRLAHDQAALQQPASSGTSGLAHAPAPQAASSGSVVVINQPPVQRWSPGLAAVLSFFVPGLGQLYKGQIINGIVWFFFVGLGYLALILPGLILHLFCILGAASGNPWTEGKTTVVRQ